MFHHEGEGEGIWGKKGVSSAGCKNGVCLTRTNFCRTDPIMEGRALARPRLSPLQEKARRSVTQPEGRPGLSKRRGYRVPLRTVGICSAICGDAMLYEILQDGFHTPLSATQIAGLFDAGCPGRPESVRRSRTARGPFHLSLSAAIALVPICAVATSIIGYLFFGAQPSVASPIVTSAISPAVHSPPALPKKQTRKTTSPRRSSSADPARSRR